MMYYTEYKAVRIIRGSAAFVRAFFDTIFWKASRKHEMDQLFVASYNKSRASWVNKGYVDKAQSATTESNSPLLSKSAK